MMRVGIVGRRGAAFYSGLRAVDGVELYGLCDLNQEWLHAEAAQHSIPFATRSFDDLLNRVEAVVIATPMQLHAQMAIQALDEGKHVLSEVTACVSLDECWRLIDAVQRSGLTYMMAENYCYFRDNVLIGELVRRGLFGELTYGEGEYLHDVKPLHHNPDGSPTWRSVWQVGVNGSTYPTHSLGPVMQWFTAADPSERIDSVVCVGSGRWTDPEHPHDDTSNLLVRLASGKSIRVRVDMLSNRPHQVGYYALQGTAGVYECSRIGGQGGHVWFGKNPAPGYVEEEHRSWQPLSDYEEFLPDRWRNPPEEALKAGHGGGDYWVVKDWVDAIRGIRPAPVDVYTACEWTAAGICSQISIANGGAPIKVPNFRDPNAMPLWVSG